MSGASNILRWLGLAGIAAIAILRALSSFAPEVYFDVDPAEHFAPLAALSPAGSLMLDVLLLLACALALLGELLTGRGLEWKLLVLAILPAPIVLWHGWHDLGDLWRGSTWLAAAAALVAVAHLARDRTMCIVLLTVLIALIGPLLVRGMAQITFEHAATVAEYEQTREQFLAHRGWEPDSPAAQIYERRLRQAQPTGWFATTNIYASVAAVGLLVLTGLAVGLVRAGKMATSRGWFIAALVIIVVAGIALYFTGSKGALLAALAGAGLLVLLTSTRLPSLLRRFTPPLLLALIALAIIGVIIRGAVLPEDFLGDRSLLFRWHYLVSSWDIVRHAPLLGVGPDGYQIAYTHFRVPRNPEEVISAHSVFADWLCTLGVLSAGWIVLALTMLWRAGRAVGVRDDASLHPIGHSEVNRLTRNVAAAVAALGMVLAIVIEFHILDELHLFMRLVGVAAFLGVAAIVSTSAQRADQRIITAGITAGAAAMLIHGQIEMTFFDPGAVVWAMCFLGVAGGAMSPPHSTNSSRASQIAVVALIVGLALWIDITGARPAMAQQSRIADAAAALFPPAELRHEQHRQREAAAALLVEAYEALSTNVVPLHSATRQIERVAADLHADARVAMLERAHALADRAATAHRLPRSLSDRAAIRAQLGVATADTRYYDLAIADLERLTQLDPHGIQPWRGLGDLLWLVGRHDEAVAAYERALENDANFVLDPLKRLPETQREQIRQRVETVRR